MIDDVNDFVSDWSKRKLNNQKFDEIFLVDGMPLSWFYRPILYSSLLPRPFPSLWDKKKSRFAGLYSFFLRRFLIRSTILKAKACVSKGDIARGKVLFLTFTNHISFCDGKVTIPKLGKVIAGVQEPFILVADPVTKLSLSVLKKCPVTIHGYHEKELWKKAWAQSKELSRLWKEIPSVKKRQWLTYNGKDLWSLVAPSLNFLYSPQFIAATIYYYSLFLKALSGVKVVVLTSQNNIYEKCCIAAAKKLGISVLIVQHGIGLGTFKTVDSLGNETFAVWGQCFKRSLVKLGVKHVEVTGNLAFDGFESVGGGEKHILVTTSCYVEDNFISKKDYLTVMKKVFADLRRVEGLPVIVKLHPREKSMEDYQKIAGGFSVIQMTTREEYKRLLSESALIVTFGSTITVEAIALGKKTILIDPFVTPTNPLQLLVPHIGSTPYVRWNQDAEKVVRDLLVRENDSEKDKEDLLYKLDGKAHERIVKVIEKLAR